MKIGKMFLALALACSLAGCSLLNTAQSAPVNKTITEVIADAGVAATTAEQMYQSGQIPQTAAARTAINDLGNAYNDAKTAYIAVLTAETTYQAAVNSQLLACAPPSTAPNGTIASTGSSATCTNATAHATATKVTLDNSNAALQTKVSMLTAKISAVKVFTAAK
jgi:hypothetical protein